MKLKTATFDAQNLRTARFVLRNEPKYGGESLLVRWARAVVAKAPTPAVVEPGAQREAQGDLFPEAA